MRDLSCVASDGNNVITTTTAIDDSECGGKFRIIIKNCEAQGKGRARGGPRKVTQRSFIDGGWWISFP